MTPIDWETLGTSSETPREIFGKSSETPRKSSGYLRKVVGNPSGNLRGPLREIFGNPSGNRREPLGNSSESCRNPSETLGNTPRKPTFPEKPTPTYSRKPHGLTLVKKKRETLELLLHTSRSGPYMSERKVNINLVGLNFCPPHYACIRTHGLRSSQCDSCRMRPQRESTPSVAKCIVREC